MLVVLRLCLLLVTTAALAAAPLLQALQDEDRNAYVITDSLYFDRGYDWCVHS